jgi:hypothetical protein
VRASRVALALLAGLLAAAPGLTCLPHVGDSSPDAETGPQPELRDPPGTDGGDPVALAVSDCAALEQRVCGLRDTDGGLRCGTLPPCQAALVIARYAPARCREKLRDPDHYPSCDVSLGCEELEVKCCGGIQDGGPCRSHAACTRALEVAALSGPDPCRQALGDDALFPRCAP